MPSLARLANFHFSHTADLGNTVVDRKPAVGYSRMCRPHTDCTPRNTLERSFAN
jgi:hypothetical protein